MCFVLMDLPFIIYKRPIEYVNPLPIAQVNKRVTGMTGCSFIANKSSSALSSGPKSHRGKRDAYGIFTKACIGLFLNIFACVICCFIHNYIESIVSIMFIRFVTR